jgi:hypothetical protein
MLCRFRFNFSITIQTGIGTELTVYFSHQILCFYVPVLERMPVHVYKIPFLS